MSYTTVAITPGAGANINVDRIASNDFQRFKPAVGAEGVAVDVSSTNPMPVVEPTTSTYHRVTTADANAVNIKASPGTLKSVHGMCVADYPVYVKLHDSASPPTAGAGVVLTVPMQAGVPQNFVIPGSGKAFANGIGITVVKDITDAGTTAVLASDAVIEVCYV